MRHDYTSPIGANMGKKKKTNGMGQPAFWKLQGKTSQENKSSARAGKSRTPESLRIARLTRVAMIAEVRLSRLGSETERQTTLNALRHTVRSYYDHFNQPFDSE